MSDRREMSCFGLLNVATGMFLTVTAFAAQAQEPIALCCQPGDRVTAGGYLGIVTLGPPEFSLELGSPRCLYWPRQAQR